MEVVLVDAAWEVAGSLLSLVSPLVLFFVMPDVFGTVVLTIVWLLPAVLLLFPAVLLLFPAVLLLLAAVVLLLAILLPAAPLLPVVDAGVTLPWLLQIIISDTSTCSRLLLEVL